MNGDSSDDFSNLKVSNLKNVFENKIKKNVALVKPQESIKRQTIKPSALFKAKQDEIENKIKSKEESPYADLRHYVEINCKSNRIDDDDDKLYTNGAALPKTAHQVIKSTLVETVHYVNYESIGTSELSTFETNKKTNQNKASKLQLDNYFKDKINKGILKSIEERKCKTLEYRNRNESSNLENRHKYNSYQMTSQYEYMAIDDVINGNGDNEDDDGGDDEIEEIYIDTTNYNQSSHTKVATQIYEEATNSNKIKSNHYDNNEEGIFFDSSNVEKKILDEFKQTKISFKTNNNKDLSDKVKVL